MNFSEARGSGALDRPDAGFRNIQGRSFAGIRIAAEGLSAPLAHHVQNL